MKARWNEQAGVWEFHEPAFGGWTVLRDGAHVSTRPMTFAEGFRHLVTHHLNQGYDGPQGDLLWLRHAANAFDIDVRRATPEAGTDG